MRSRLLVATIVIVSCLCSGPLVAVGQTPNPTSSETTAHSKIIRSTNFSALRFQGAPNADGLVIEVGDPAIRVDFPIAVLNATNDPMVNLRLAVTTFDNGKEVGYDDNVWIFPMRIEPGEFGFGTFDPGFSGTRADSQFVFERLPPADNASDVVDLEIVEGRISDDHLVGEVANPTDHDVTKIEIHSLCVEDSGVMLDTSFDILDRRLLAAGDTIEFTTPLPGDPVWGDDCSDQALFFTAIAQLT